MTNNGSSSTIGAEFPVPVSSQSSLDSFMMELPSSDSGIDSTIPTTLNDLNSATATAAAVASASMTAPAQAPAPVLLPRNPHLEEGGASFFGIQQNSIVPAPALPPPTSSVPEFLYQLTKMLTDDNREKIEWSNGKRGIKLLVIH